MSFITKNFFKNALSARQIHFSRRLNIDPKTVEEIRIPVPWGHIAGKRWGNNSCQPIIAVHGLLDNAATFDKLIPLIKAPSVLCIDIPGHGQSSHLPKGVSLYYLDYVMQLRFILKYLFKWDKNLIFLGHSFGSSILFSYAAIYSEEVSKMINIDCARIRSAINIDKFIEKTKESVDNFIHSENYSFFEQCFTFDECLNHTMKTRQSLQLPVSMEKCKILCSRGTNNLGNGKYYFTHDRRLKYGSFGRNTKEYNLALASRIKCSMLNIHATGGINSGKFKEEEDKQLKIISENTKSCTNLMLEGSHHIHLETPDVIAPHINKFLTS